MPKQPSEGTTGDVAVSAPGGAATACERFLALVLVWSEDEPSRIGEVVLVPSRDPSLRFCFGRGAARVEDESVRLSLQRQRPGAGHKCPPLAAQWLSRQQLLFAAGAE